MNYERPNLEKNQEMLDKDYPVILSYNSESKEQMKLHYYDAGSNSYSSLYGGSSHYVTVTGIVYNCDYWNGNDTALEISSWGNKYLIKYDEYVDYVEKETSMENNNPVDLYFNRIGNGMLYFD